MVVMACLRLTLFGCVVLVVAACTGGSPSSEQAEPDAPLITESETGRIIGQPVDPVSLTVEVTGEGSALIVVAGSVPVCLCWRGTAD